MVSLCIVLVTADQVGIEVGYIMYLTEGICNLCNPLVTIILGIQ